MLLGEFLLSKKLITKYQLEAALAEQKVSGEFLGAILIRKKAVKGDFLKALSEQFNIPFVSLENQAIDWNVAARFTAALIVDRRCMPLKEDERGITMAIVNPLDVIAVSQAEKEAKNTPIRLVLVSSADMDVAQATYRECLSKKIKKLFE